MCLCSLFSTATRAGPHKPVHCQSAAVLLRAEPRKHAEGLRHGDLDTDPPQARRRESRRGVRAHGEQREV